MGSGITNIAAPMPTSAAMGSVVGGSSGPDFTVTGPAAPTVGLGGSTGSFTPIAQPAAGVAALAGGPAAAGGGTTQQLISALTALVQALEGLVAVLQQGGASSVTGGGAPSKAPVGAAGETGCSCGCHRGAPAKGASPAPSSPSQVLADPTAPVPTAATPGTDPQDTPVGQAPPVPVGAGDVRQRMVQLAQGELAKGVREDAGADEDSRGIIRGYREAVTGDGESADNPEAWCADFASWVSREAGVPIGIDGKGEDYTVALIDWAKGANRWHEREGAQPGPGDLVLFDWDGDGGAEHVAIVERVEGGKIHTIGGNEGDGAIQQSSYDLGDGQILGYVPPQGA